MSSVNSVQFRDLYTLEKPPLFNGNKTKVYRCTEKATGLSFACKKVFKKFEDRENPELEQNALEKLKGHPNIIQIKEVLEDKDHRYLVTELITDCMDMLDYINTQGVPKPDQAMKIFKQIVSALKFINDQNIVHRDLKPDNVLIATKTFNIKLIDFGFAREISKDQLMNTSCGSPWTVSPEILQGKDYDGKKSDVWSLGVILFTLVAGVYPFDHENMCVLVNLVIKGEYKIPSYVDPLISDLIRSILNLDPLKRPSVEDIMKHNSFKLISEDDFKSQIN